jgi:DNA-binding NarL/FixJ family response regulator
VAFAYGVAAGRRWVERAAPAVPAVPPAPDPRPPAAADRPGEPPPPLTRRERDVLRQLAGGRSNAEIAGALFVSEATVKSHVARLLNKLELDNRVQLALFAHKHGLHDDQE